MTNLVGQLPESTFGDLLTTTNSGQGLSNVLQNLQDGLGNNSTVSIANNGINFNTTGGNTFQLDGVALTTTATLINNIAGSRGIQCLSGSLSSAQILNMGVTPVEVLAAPGPGFMITVHSLAVNYIYGGTPYANGGNIFLVTGSVPASENITSLAGVNANNYMITVPYTAAVLTSTAINSPLVIGNAGGNYTAGNGTINYFIWYSILAIH